MNIPQNLPITPLQSKAARYQLGLTQANVIGESDLPGHKLKSFETGRFIPDMKFLDGLKTFYEGKGINLSDLKEGDGLVPAAASTQPAPQPGASMVRPVHRMCFYVSDQIPDDQLDAILGRMDENDNRIADTLPQVVGSGFLSEFDDATVQKQRELFGAMSENYLLFRILQGRNILRPTQPDTEAKTHADVVSKFFAGSPLASLFATAVPAASTPADDDVGNVEGGEE